MKFGTSRFGISCGRRGERIKDIIKTIIIRHGTLDRSLNVVTELV